MSNAIYTKAREGYLDGTMGGWAAVDVRVALLSAGYAPNLATNKFVSDLGANIVARTGTLPNRTATDGIANHDPVTVTPVSGAAVTRYAYFVHTGSDATARLIALIDTATGAPGLPATPNGGAFVVSADAGINKLFVL
jgi:hypothetical protein